MGVIYKVYEHPLDTLEAIFHNHKIDVSISETAKGIKLVFLEDKSYMTNERIIHCLGNDILLENSAVTQEQLKQIEDYIVKIGLYSKVGSTPISRWIK